MKSTAFSPFSSQNNNDGWGWGELYNYTKPGTNITQLLRRDDKIVPILGWPFVSIHALLVLLVTVMTILRRNHQPVKARNWVLMLVTLYSEFLVAMNTEIRLSVKRWIYPCIIYSFSYNIALAFIAFPLIMRSWKLLFVYKLNYLKKLLGGFRGGYSSAEQISAAAAAEETTIDPQSIFKDKGQERLFQRLAFWVSNPCMLIMLLIFVAIGILFWAICWAVYQPNRILFVSFWPCEMSFSVIIVCLVQTSIYVLIEMVLIFLMCINKVKDNWGIKTETVISLFLWSSSITLFAFANSILYDCCFTEVDRVWPAGRYVTIASFIDSCNTCLLPVIRTFRCPIGRKRGSMDGNYLAEKLIEDGGHLNEVLYNDELRELFKQFSVESFCAENVLFWEEITFKYKRLKNKMAAINYAEQIINKYIETGSPLELNLDSKQRNIALLRCVIDTQRETHDKRKEAQLSDTETIPTAAPVVEEKTKPRNTSIFFSRSNRADLFPESVSENLDTKNVEPADDVELFTLFDTLVTQVELNMSDTIARFSETSDYKKKKNELQQQMLLLEKAGLADDKR